MLKEKINKEQRAQIVTLKGKMQASDIAPLYGISTSRVRGIWFDARGGRNGSVKQVNPIDFKGRLTKSIRRELPTPLPDEPVTEDGVSFDDLAEHSCRWPIGKDQDNKWRFCGCERKVSRAAIACQSVMPTTARYVSSYCDTHAEKAAPKVDLTMDDYEEKRQRGHRISMDNRKRDGRQFGRILMERIFSPDLAPSSDAMASEVGGNAA